MRLFADIYVRGREATALHLRMAAEAEVRVALRQQLGIDRAVGRVAHRAPFPQSRMLEHKGPGLLTMTGGAGFVGAGHR
jgi:hypothetical protein